MVITRTSIYCGENYFTRKDRELLYDTIPPLIGCVISDKDGKSIISFEVFKGAIHNFIKDSSLINGHCDYAHLDIDLIPMYTSAIEMLTRELHIEGVPYIEINGSNLKLRIFFEFKDFTVILFLNPIIQLDLIEDHIKEYLNNLFEEFDEIFNDVSKRSSREFLNSLERICWCWLVELNELYLSLI